MTPPATLRAYIPDGRTLAEFMASTGIFRGLMGPWGSGKSVCCVQEILRKSTDQHHSIRDGVRRSRWAITRETVVEMRSTTMKTWHDWVPKAAGKWRDTGPPRHLVRWRHADGGVVELEALFLAMDNPSDVAQLDSLELTGAWINEARHLIWDNVRNMIGRTNRYPAIAEGGSAHGFMVIADTNPPDVEHWWYDKFEEDRPDAFKIFKQPSGRSGQAENLRWLPKGYYQTLQIGQTEEWIRVYVDGKYGYSADGKPIYRMEFNDLVHVAAQPIKPYPNIPVLSGFDAGLTPAGTFFQHLPDGQWVGLAELTTEPGSAFGAKRFGGEVNRLFRERFEGLPVGDGWADPSAQYGADKAQGELNWIETVANVTAINIRPAPSNELSVRFDAVKEPLKRTIDGVKPGLIICPTMRVLRKGFNNGYRLRRIQVGGGPRYTPEPEKNYWSHAHESAQYVLLGGGEWHAVTGRDEARRRGGGIGRQHYALSDYDVLGERS